MDARINPARCRWSGRVRRVVSAALVALAMPAAYGQATASPAPDAPAAPKANPMAFDAVPAKISFDVVSFKPCPDGKFGDTKVDQPPDADYLAYHCETVWRMIYFAYNGAVMPFKIASGYPAWVDHRSLHEFIVKVAPEDVPAWQKLDLPGRRVLVRDGVGGYAGS